MARTYIKPWTNPVVRGTSVSCWGRTYDFAGSILPSRVLSQRENILAAPFSVQIIVGGEAVRIENPHFSVVTADEEAVHYKTTATANNISLECLMTTEFDGMTRVDMTITPLKTIRVDSLDLIVPLKSEYAKLFHHSSIYPLYDWKWMEKRMNAGIVKPEGMKLPFVFHIWLGNDDRGIQLFSESDEAWSPADPDSAVTVTPANNVTTLRMNLLNDYVLKQPWKWTFGFIATPVKPFPSEFYTKHYSHMGGYGIESRDCVELPANAENPPSYLDMLHQWGVKCLGIHERWSDEQSLPRPKESDKPRLKSLIQACHDKGMQFVVYTGCYMGSKSPEYTRDWDTQPVGDNYQYQRPLRDNGDICRITCNNTGYPELLIKEYAKAFEEYGFDGLYLDGLTCPVPCNNTKHGCGYVGKNGEIKCTMPIWRTRELIKTLYRMVKDKSSPGPLVAHTSGSILLPALSFVDFYQDGEHMLAYRIGSKYFPEEAFRAQMAGHNFGIPAVHQPNPSIWLKNMEAERQRAITFCLLYDVLWFWHPEHQLDIWKAWDSFGMTSAKYVPFWRISELVSLSNARCDVRVSAYLDKGRGALFVVGNLGKSAQSFKLRIKRSGLGLDSACKLRARDEIIGGLELWVQGDEVTLTVPAGRFRMVSVQSLER